MALSRMKATTIALSLKDDRLLSRAARERKISRSEFIRQHLAIVLEQYQFKSNPIAKSLLMIYSSKEDGREKKHEEKL